MMAWFQLPLLAVSLYHPYEIQIFEIILILGGTYLGTLDGVNHLELVGWVNQARNTITEWMGGEANFRPATFYLGVANTLAEVVEGQQRKSNAVLDPGAALVKEPESIQGMPAEQSLPKKQGLSPKTPAKKISVDSRGRTVES